MDILMPSPVRNSPDIDPGIGKVFTTGKSESMEININRAGQSNHYVEKAGN